MIIAFCLLLRLSVDLVILRPIEMQPYFEHATNASSLFHLSLWQEIKKMLQLFSLRSEIRVGCTDIHLSKPNDFENKTCEKQHLNLW